MSDINKSRMNVAEPRFGVVNSYRGKGAWEGKQDVSRALPKASVVEPANGSLTNNFFGSDIAIDKNSDVIVAANGELVLTGGIDTLHQDIRLRLTVGLGTLFYDSSYGSNLPLFINDDEEGSTSIEAEIIRSVEKDPRIEPYSVTAKVMGQTLEGVTVSLSWQCVGSDSLLNEVIAIKRNI